MNVLITGAGRGIGFELAQQFATEGHKTFALSRNIDALTELKGQGISALYPIQYDLANLSYNKDLKELVARKAPHLDIIINNAGQLLNKEFNKITAEEIQAVYNINVFSPFFIVQTFFELLRKSANPHVVNISSMGGFQNSVKFPGLSAYSSSKGALTVLTECMAEEFKEVGIKVNCLCLGAVNTEMLKAAFPDYNAPLSAMEMASYIKDFSLKGWKYYNGKILPVSVTTP